MANLKDDIWLTPYLLLQLCMSIKSFRNWNFSYITQTAIASSGLPQQAYVPFDIFPTRCNITQFIYFRKTALHVSGGISTHHQEHAQLYLQYLVLVNPLLLPATMVEELELVWVWCGNCIDLFWCGCRATVPKQINTIPTPHSNQFQLFHKSSILQ